MSVRKFLLLIIALCVFAFTTSGQGLREILIRKDNASHVFDFKNENEEAVPTFVDIDDDGDLDIFQGQGDGFISFYKNIGDEIHPLYTVPVSNPFGIGDNFENSAPVFVDLDNDGDYDLYVGTRGLAFLGISAYYENVGTSEAPMFERLDDNTPFGLMPEGAHFFSKPTFGDLDADGDQDILFGAQDGFLFQENIGTPESPDFGTIIATPFGLPSYSFSEELSPILYDFDYDGDLDVITGRINGNITWYRNIGDSENPLFQGSSVRQLIRENKGRTAPALGDIDNDGDIDMVVAYPTGDHLDWYMGVAGQSHFVPDTNFSVINAIDVGFSSTPEFVDIDYDGDLDVLIGSTSGDLYYHLNIGTLQSPDYLIHTVNPFGLINIGTRSSPSSVSFDNSGKQTLFIGVESGDFWEFENIGGINNPSYVLKGINTRGLGDIGSVSTPAFVSLDGTDDYDLISGEVNGGFKHFVNQGNGVDPQFVQGPDNPFGIIDVGFASSPTFIDFDGDLDLDMFSGDLAGNIHFFRNDNLFVPMYGLKQTNFFDLYDYALVSSPTAGDVDNDGDVDLLVGYTNGKSILFENRPCKASYPLNHISTGQQLYQSEGTITTKAYIPNIADVTLLGTWGIEIEPGFEVSYGGELQTEVGACKNN